jgi:hypothetical protein
VSCRAQRHEGTKRHYRAKQKIDRIKMQKIKEDIPRITKILSHKSNRLYRSNKNFIFHAKSTKSSASKSKFHLPRRQRQQPARLGTMAMSTPVDGGQRRTSLGGGSRRRLRRRVICKGHGGGEEGARPWRRPEGRERRGRAAAERVRGGVGSGAREGVVGSGEEAAGDWGGGK